MNKHYVCGECKSTAQHTGVCDTENCIQQGSERKACFCEDGEHKDVMNEWKEDPAEEPFEGAKEKTIDLDNQTQA